jgi:hypothetical protein
MSSTIAVSRVPGTGTTARVHRALGICPSMVITIATASILPAPFHHRHQRSSSRFQRKCAAAIREVYVVVD